MNTGLYVTELSFIKRKLLVEDTPPIDTTAETKPAPGPDPTTTEKEKPAPSSIKKTSQPDASGKEAKSAFIGGALSNVGSQIFHKIYDVVSGDIYHRPDGRVGNNPAYTGSGYNR